MSVLGFSSTNGVSWWSEPIARRAAPATPASAATAATSAQRGDVGKPGIRCFSLPIGERESDRSVLSCARATRPRRGSDWFTSARIQFRVWGVCGALPNSPTQENDDAELQAADAGSPRAYSRKRDGRDGTGDGDGEGVDDGWRSVDAAEQGHRRQRGQLGRSHDAGRRGQGRGPGRDAEGRGPFTVFAPTNAAFAQLPAGTVDTLLKPENKAQLTQGADLSRRRRQLDAARAR